MFKHTIIEDVNNNRKTVLGAAAYQPGNTSSRTITEVKQCWVRLALGWETLFKSCLSAAANP